MMAIGDGIALAVLNMDCLTGPGLKRDLGPQAAQCATQKARGHLSSSGDDPQNKRPPT